MKRNLIIMLIIAVCSTGCITDLSRKGVTQTLTYSGRIIEAANTPIADAKVSVTDGKKEVATTHTNIDGKFTIEAQFDDIDENYELQATYRDFTTTAKLLGYGTGGRDLGDIVLYDKNDYYFAPQVKTSYLYNATANSILCGGVVKDISKYPTPITEYGICYYEESMPALTADTIRLNNGDSIFSYTLSNLDLDSKTYHIKAFATNEIGTTYGEERIANHDNIYYESLPTIILGDTIYHVYIHSDFNVLYDGTIAELSAGLLQYTLKLGKFAGYDDWTIPTSKLLIRIAEADPSIFDTETRYWAYGENVFYYDNEWKIINDPNAKARMVEIRYDIKKE